MLNAEQLSRYEENGFLSPLDVIAADEAHGLRQIIESVERDPHLNELPRPASQYLRTGAQFVLPEVCGIAGHPGLLDKVKALLGPDLLLYSADVFTKEAGSEDYVSWHQDLTYWGLGETNDEITAWVALSEASIESGCMRFIPGSHKKSLLEHEDGFGGNNLLSRGQTVKAEIDEATAVYAPLQPGQFSFHHGHLFHASSPNRSSDRRVGLALRFVTPTVRQSIASRDYAILLAGIDNTQNWVHVAPPRRAFDPHYLDIHQQTIIDRAAALSRNADAALRDY